ncbi:MAG: OmpA family protein [Rhizobiaceae bacterium]|nr:OmpA family protein [Rhizobiaceae bacterium]MCV0408036.1 OmpA family protein [Rhizobiaceae bacterium]
MTVPLGTPAQAGTMPDLKPDLRQPLILAQAEQAEDEEELPPEEEAPAQAEQPAEEPPAQAEQPAEEPPAQAEEPPAQAEQPAEEPPAQAEEPAEQPPAQAEQPPEEPPAQAEQSAEEPPAQAEQPAEEPPAQAEEPAEEPPAQAEQPAEESPAQAEQPAEEAPAQAEQPAEEAPAQAEQPAEEAPAPAEEPAEAQEPAEAEEPVEAEQPAEAEEPVQAEEPAETEGPAEAVEPDDEAEQQPAGEADEQTGEAGEQAPVLDSQKEQPVEDGEAADDQAEQQPAEGEEQPVEGEEPAPEEAESAPPPSSDAEAQAVPVERETIESSIAEEGERIDVSVEEVRERFRENRREREGTEVVREFQDNRTIIQFNNQIFVESPDAPRIARGAREVYYEELPRGRTREVIIRENGVQVITIRNRYGDVIRRSRITPDNREYVLYYVPEQSWDRVDEWRDPGRDLPPLRLTIPVEEYILDAETVQDPDVYYTFFDQPPVERVERLYSVDEVKRSARIRDTVRRVDLDVINFEFGSAEVSESEIGKLDAVASAMARMLEENPAETFLIEGHTDAVGSDMANLALSDRRAEAIAQALTNVFDIPPENLATQGYGEQYLKVNTEEPERENRRVAIRRITPLVAPVASAN